MMWVMMMIMMRGLKPILYRLFRPWSPWGSSPAGKIPMAEPGIKPGTS
jgi:hypothetical protein